MGHRLARADLFEVVVAQSRCGHGHGFPVVEHQQAVQAQLLARGFDGELPVVVRHLQHIAVDGVGDRDAGLAHRGLTGLLQIGLRCGGQVRVLASGQRDFLRDGRAIAMHQGKAGIGAADVAQKAWRVGWGGVVHVGHGCVGG